MLSRVGRYRDAEARIARGVKAAEQAKDGINLTLFPALSAWVALERGDYPGAQEATRRAERALPLMSDAGGRRTGGLVVALLDGATKARLGRLDAARARLDELKKAYDARQPRETWWYRALEGEVALATRDLDKAYETFSAGEPELKMS